MSTTAGTQHVHLLDFHMDIHIGHAHWTSTHMGHPSLTPLPTTQPHHPHHPSPIPNLPEMRFAWTSLPPDLRDKILSQLPLSELLRLQPIFPYTAPCIITQTITNLRPLHKAWQIASIPVRNIPPFRTRASRNACAPAAFITLPRLILTTASLPRLPHCIGLLTKLKVLHLDNNHLSRLPDTLVGCVQLKLLDLSNNRFAALPEVVLRLASLRHLVVSHNPIEELPHAIVALAHLDTLACYGCKLTELPDVLLRRVDARRSFVLNVAGNQFPRGYLRALCAQFQGLRFRLAHTMIDDA